MFSFIFFLRWALEVVCNFFFPQIDFLLTTTALVSKAETTFIQQVSIFYIHSNSKTANEYAGYTASIVDVFLPCARRRKPQKDVRLELDVVDGAEQSTGRSKRRKGVRRGSTLGSELDTPLHISVPHSKGRSRDWLRKSSTPSSHASSASLSPFWYPTPAATSLLEEATPRSRLSEVIGTSGASVLGGEIRAGRVASDSESETEVIPSKLLVDLSEFSLEREIGRGERNRRDFFVVEEKTFRRLIVVGVWGTLYLFLLFFPPPPFSFRLIVKSIDSPSHASKGAAGEVYRGWLRGTMVAAKQMYSEVFGEEHMKAVLHEAVMLS